MTSTIGLNVHLDWPHGGQVVRIERTREIGDQTQRETAYFITSLTPRQASAETLLGLARGHWAAIENRLHYVRDETLGEDRCTICRGHAPQNLAALRNAALNWLRQQGPGNLAARIRSFTRNSHRLFALLGIVN